MRLRSAIHAMIVEVDPTVEQQRLECVHLQALGVKVLRHLHLVLLTGCLHCVDLVPYVMSSDASRNAVYTSAVCTGGIADCLEPIRIMGAASTDDGDVEERGHLKLCQSHACAIGGRSGVYQAF